MRFHHSTRRGRNRQAGCGGGGGQTSSRFSSGHKSHSTTTSRWAQLSYCRQTNIHFYRRVLVEPPQPPPSSQARLSEGLSQSDEHIMTPGISYLPTTNGGHQHHQHYNKPHKQTNGHDNDSFETEQSTTISNKLNKLSLKQSVQNDKSPLGCMLEEITSDSSSSIAMSGRKTKDTTTAATQAIHCDLNNEFGGNGPRQPALDMESARKRLVAQVEKHPFWSNKAAKRMRLVSLAERRVYLYELTSYCERRELEWRYEPYRGGLVAGSTPFRRLEQNSPNTGSLSTPSTPPGGGAHLRARIQNHSSPLATTGGTSVPPPPAHSLRLQVASPLISLSGTAANKRKFIFDIDNEFGTTLDQQEGGADESAKSPIRRSCSSATAAASATPTVGSCSSGNPQPLEPEAQLVWTIEVPVHLRPAPFACYVHHTELPNSSFVKRCHGCQGIGRLKCTSCQGVGYEVCLSCSGKGTIKSLGTSRASWMASTSVGQRSSRSRGGGGGGIDGAETYGSMWDSAAGDSSSSGACRRYDEPGGVTSGGGSLLSSAGTESCHFCHGAGQKRCWICAGRGRNTCLACAGTGQLRCYLRLNVTWLNHRDECVLNNADSIIPRDRLRLSSGLLLADQQAPHLSALDMSTQFAALANTQTTTTTTTANTTPYQTDCQQEPLGGAQETPGGIRGANNATSAPTETSREHALLEDANLLHSISGKMLARHAELYGKQELLVRQRHRVTQIECFVVNWEWKRRRGHFVIYGDERKVYIAKYPFKSICNIT